MKVDSFAHWNVDSPRARVCPPAKLNLFLELLARRDDGFHEIDTVMVPIEWCDEMWVRPTREPGVTLSVGWMPTDDVMAARLGVSSESLELPNGPENLVYQALQRFQETFPVGGGFECRLWKGIPAGAGMGGASSDAAAALRCAASLSRVPMHAPRLAELAAELGSDVPFFLGIDGKRVSAARAQGRGERLSPVPMAGPLDVVAVFPGQSLSTAHVYAASQVPEKPQSSDDLIDALASGDLEKIGGEMMNRLSQPAREIAPRIDEILKSLWRTGLRTCQLTGSGSACFAIANSSREACRAAAQLRAELEPGALIAQTRTVSVPPRVEIV